MLDINAISALGLQGGNFKDLTKLELFNYKNKNLRASLIYGENGTGKTTISKAFLKLRGIDKKEILQATLYNKESEAINTELNNKNIYVFNEDFINENVKLKRHGLDSIVIMGNQNRIDDKINKIIEKEKKPVETSLDEVEKNIAQFYRYSSPKFYLEKIKDKLRGPGSWAERDSKIKNNRQNSPVRADTYKKFNNGNKSLSKDDLIREFYKLLDKRNNISKLYLEKPIIGNAMVNLKSNINKINELLPKKVENPNLSTREENLISIVNQVDSKISLNKIEQYFATKRNYCPLCLQSISNDYQKNLVSSLKKILNKDVKNHQIELKNQRIKPISINFDKYKSIEGAIECKSKEENLNGKIDELNQKIEQKINTPYIPIYIDNSELFNKISDLEQALIKLNVNIDQYNKKIGSVSDINNKLEKINVEIASIEIQDDVVALEESKKKEKDLNLNEETLIKKKQDIDLRLEELTEEKKNVKIAIESINSSLKYIFFSSHRLSLKYENDEYTLYSRHESVLPDEISVGERNIIALCYFFSTIFQNRDKADYNKPYLIVIDDPVSSFDKENKIGIISYLKYKLSQFLEGNKKTKVLLLSHDLEVVADMEKAIKEISNIDKNNCRIFQLNNNQLISNDDQEKNEYSRMLKNIFKFALGEKEDINLEIGNEMRRVLEAYGTFNYKKGISKISYDDTILDKLRKEHRLYFKNLMYRIVLDGESHTRDRINRMSDLNIDQFISKEEKRRTARDIICFLYELDNIHVVTHLKEKGSQNDQSEKKEIEDTIEQWCNEIQCI